mgnify:FL=1
MPNDADSLTGSDVDENSSPDAGVRSEDETVDEDATELHAAILDDELDPPVDDGDASPDSEEQPSALDADANDALAGIVTAEDLDSDYSDEALLFDGDPEEFELDFGGEFYPEPVPQAGDMIVLDEPTGPVGPAPRRMSRMERRRRVRLQARRVRRIIRHVEPWSVLKISIFFYACLWVIFLVAGFIVWGVAESSGTVEKVEDLVTDLFALDSFDFDAGQIFRGYALGGLALSIAGTTFNVLMCLLFNLISDLTGGLRITMIEEETARPTPPRRRRRRPPPR